MRVLGYDELPEEIRRAIEQYIGSLPDPAVRESLRSYYKNLRYIYGAYAGNSVNEHGAKTSDFVYPDENHPQWLRVIKLIYATNHWPTILPGSLSSGEISQYAVYFVDETGNLPTGIYGHTADAFWANSRLEEQLPPGSVVITPVEPVNNYLDISEGSEMRVLADAGVSGQEYCRTGTETDPPCCYAITTVGGSMFVLRGPTN